MSQPQSQPSQYPLHHQAAPHQTPHQAQLQAPVNRSSAHDLLTLIITTSPTPSAPSTELLSAILVSFRKHCPDLTACRVVLVIDTYDHIASAARLKKGHVTADGAQNHEAYKENAKKLILHEFSQDRDGYEDDEDENENENDDDDGHVLLVTEGDAEYGSSAYAQQTNAVPLTITRTKDGRISFIEPLQRLGFGLAVRSALRLTETPYVWIQQHDWSLIYDIPLAPLLTIMQESEAVESESEPDYDYGSESRRRQTVTVPVKYVCFPSVRMLSYATSDHVMQFPALRALTNLYKQNFSNPTAQAGASKIPLTPLFFWHDKPHIASTEHYLSQVFPNRVAMLRGAFIEDTAGHRARTEMKDGQWKKWACWLYYPDEGKQLCVRHLKGRTWRGAEGELEQKFEWMRLNSLAS